MQKKIKCGSSINEKKNIHASEVMQNAELLLFTVSVVLEKNDEVLS